MTELTQRTTKVIAALFPKNEQGIVSDELVTNCSTNIPGCDNWSNVQLERIWFAVLKLSVGQLNKLESSIKLANTDYRDLLMAADFGCDLEAHNKWFKELSC